RSKRDWSSDVCSSDLRWYRKKTKGRSMLRPYPSPSRPLCQSPAPWHFLNFLPLPQGHGSLRPMPAYGFEAGAGGTPGGSSGPPVGPLLTRPSAVGLVAITGEIFFLGGAPSGPEGAPRWGGGPISICSLSQRSAKVACTSRIRPTNIS